MCGGLFCLISYSAPCGCAQAAIKADSAVSSSAAAARPRDWQNLTSLLEWIRNTLALLQERDDGLEEAKRPRLSACADFHTNFCPDVWCPDVHNELCL